MNGYTLNLRITALSVNKLQPYITSVHNKVTQTGLDKNCIIN